MPEISTSTVSPAFIQTGGLRPAPTPPGVPVTMTSPGSSCVHVEQYSMSCGTSKQSSATLSCCMTAPFKRVVSVSVRGLGISSAVTSQGPNAPLAFLTHWKQVNAKHIAEGVKEFGAKGFVVSSDLGQSANITHPDGLEVAIGAMKREGISDADIDVMMRKNPAKLLGLAN